MSANPGRRDKWPPPQQWRHVWVRFGLGATPAPYPGLIIEWKREGARWFALVVYLEEDAYDHHDRRHRPAFRQRWIRAQYLRPAPTDVNAIWNDGPWR